MVLAIRRPVAEKLGIGSTETLRKWVRQDQIDTGQRPGTSSEESAQLRAADGSYTGEPLPVDLAANRRRSACE
jgi:transposase-like protein